MLAENTAVQQRGNSDDHEYDSFIADLNRRFSKRFGTDKERLFTTDATGLFDAYLAAFPDDTRKFHHCYACRRFLEHFGSLVTIAEGGLTSSAVWDDCNAPPMYAVPIAAMERIVRRAKVTGVFLSSEPTWGIPLTKVWRHFAINGCGPSLYLKNPIKTASQASAEKSEEFGIVMRALAEHSAETAQQVVTLLKSDQMPRAEKVLGNAEWLSNLHKAVADAPKNRRANVVWRAIASAPAGFCHPRSSMLGTLLDDVAAGKSFGEISRAYGAKMGGLQYQRPQSAPTAGNIAAAEKMIADLGLAPALERRFARLDEIQAFWRPTPQPEKPAGAGVFSHLTPKGSEAASPIIIPATTMTWEKFQKTTLPDAVKLEAMVPSHGNFSAMLTALHDDAPPILMYDRPEQRNPFSTYVYHGGSYCHMWGLSAGWVEITALTLRAQQWFDGNYPNQSRGVLMVLQGAKDTLTGQGNALFPELMRSELHGIRAVVEAFSKSATIHGIDQASACGLIFDQGRDNWNQRLRVTRRDGGTSEVIIDRWD